MSQGAIEATTSIDRITLPRSMEMENIEAAMELLRGVAANPPPAVTVDMGEIALVDASAVQLMLSFLRTMQAAGVQVNWENLSVQLYQEAAALGLEAELGY